jgi:deazaflavin-dependent oxidoreductase (nitroreductase family)
LSVVSRQSVLVLATRGRKSGLTRKTPVTYLPYEDGFLIGGGAGGQKATPDWVLNLRANPRAQITIGRTTHDVTVDEPTGEARERAYAALATKWPEVKRYEQRGGRPLPLFILRTV